LRFQFVAIAFSSIVITVGTMPKATAQQIPLLPNLQTPNFLINELEKAPQTRWVFLDGRRLFQIAAPKGNLAQRSQDIQQRLDQLSQEYFQKSDAEPNVQITPEKKSTTKNGKTTVTETVVILLNGQYLMTVNDYDASLQQQDTVDTVAKQIVEKLKEGLKRAKQERQSKFLIQQGQIAAAAGVAMIVLSWGVYSYQHRRKKYKAEPVTTASAATRPITIQLNQQEQKHITEVKRRLYQLAQATIWGGGSLYILGLFPYTRALQQSIIFGAQIPLKVGVVALGTYVVIRLSYALIDRFSSALVNSAVLLTPEAPERIQLRVSTISGVSKSIATITCIVVGTLIGLGFLGVELVPLLAGASLVGVAVSLASQSLIKDAINGFLIILEDQYALGDYITVGTFSGLVENLNLRMTQVRDGEGRLITIPNSEIKVVANLSSRWSRADLTIPVAYQTDVDQAIKLIQKVGVEMDEDPLWDHQILETPQVLGIDNFAVAEKGFLIRVWIKTQPLKQWSVAREYRRRLKIAFDQAGISIFLP
jgi:small conductance mechanosensitive channel